MLPARTTQRARFPGNPGVAKPKETSRDRRGIVCSVRGERCINRLMVHRADAPKIDIDEARQAPGGDGHRGEGGAGIVGSGITGEANQIHHTSRSFATSIRSTAGPTTASAINSVHTRMLRAER